MRSWKPKPALLFLQQDWMLKSGCWVSAPACDVMEVVTPLADEMVLALVLRRVFKPNDFFGDARSNLPDTSAPIHRLTHTRPIWRRAIARPVEKVAPRLLQSLSKKRAEE